MQSKFIKHNSPSFIGAYYIDQDLCKAIISDFTSSDKVHKDNSGFKNYYYLRSDVSNQELRKKYIQSISSCLEKYIAEYSFCSVSTPFFISDLYNIQAYLPNDAYSVEHIEDLGPQKGQLVRKLVFLTYLNSIDSGGETEFIYQNIKVKPEEGLTLIWPAGWTHPHKGLPTTSTKFIATGWIPYTHRC